MESSQVDHIGLNENQNHEKKFVERFIEEKDTDVDQDCIQECTNSLNKLENGSVQSESLTSQGKSSKNSRQDGFCEKLSKRFARCMWKNHDRPSQADSCYTKCRYFCMCPPHGKVVKFISLVVLAFLTWAVPWSIIPEKSMPGGNIFALVILFLSCLVAGYLISRICIPGVPPLPPLLGMLIMGFVLRNVPGIDVAKNIDPDWSSSLRMIALTIILTRAGIGLDGKALMKLKWILLGFACSTSVVESCVVACFSTILLGFTWEWGFVLGFVLCAVSPAVVVPSLLYLQDKGYGVEGGIPSFLIASAALNDVIGITGFHVVLGMIFSDGNIFEKIIHGPLELLLGFAVGSVLGVFMWYFPSPNMKGRASYRMVMLLGLALFCSFASKIIHYVGAGALATLVMAFVAANRWGLEKKKIAKQFANMWIVFQPLLFGLIGASVKMENLEPQVVGLGCGLIAIGLVFRSVAAFLSVFWTDFNKSEKIFLTVSWVPKATVQAAIGGVALDLATGHDAPPDIIEYATKVLTLAVLSILLTAPTGAGAIGLSGPKLLKRTVVEEIEDCEV